MLNTTENYFMNTNFEQMRKTTLFISLLIFSISKINAQTYQWPSSITYTSTSSPQWDQNWVNLDVGGVAWSPPVGVWTIVIEAWGAGGGSGGANNGGGATSYGGSGGGGGGAYSKKTLTNITETSVFYITTGERGRAGQGSESSTLSTNGGNSFVRLGSPSGTIICEAEGGKRSLGISGQNSGAGGAGGLASNGTGDVVSSGGNGAAGAGGSGNPCTSCRGGGGGGGAGDPNNGGNGSGASGGTGGGTGGGVGGSGRTVTSGAPNGGIGLVSGDVNNSLYGAGGGGAVSKSTQARQGAAGHPGVVRITIISTLGVQLSNFIAVCEGLSTNVLWTTDSEKNSDYFTLERSRDGQDWSQVVTLSGAGTTNLQNTYSYNDNLYDEIYYRLKQVDFDGKTQYYGPITVNCVASDNSLLVFPNPSNGEFGVEIHSSEVLENASVVVYDNTGKQLLRSELNNTLKGTNMVYFSDSKLAAGSYLVVLESETKHTLKPVKLVIQ